VKGGNVILIVKGDNIFPTKLKFADQNTDRCFLEIREGRLSPISGIKPFTSLEVGEKVYTMGSPSGLVNTLGEGIVSGLRQEDNINYVQTTAPISPGSSGGGLFDAKGNLVGITTFLLKNTQNLNFAISADAFWE